MPTGSNAQVSLSAGELLETNYSGLHTITQLSVDRGLLHFGAGLSQNWSQSYVEAPLLGLALELGILVSNKALDSSRKVSQRFGVNSRHAWPLKYLSVHQYLLTSTQGYRWNRHWGLQLQIGYGLVFERTGPWVSDRIKRSGLVNLGCVYLLDI